MNMLGKYLFVFYYMLLSNLVFIIKMTISFIKHFQTSFNPYFTIKPFCDHTRYKLQHKSQ